MNIKDFFYMRQGKHLKALTPAEETLLHPIDIRGAEKERVLLLLHGFSSSPAVYRKIIPELKPFYDAIICPVLPGHAESIEAFAKVQFKDWINTSEEICASLVNEYKTVDVLGLSLGGLLASHLSGIFPIHHLYLLAPALQIKINLSLALTLASLLKWLGFKPLKNKGGNIKSTQSSELAYRVVPLTCIIEILTLIKNFKWQPPTCPTDLFLGKYDEVVDSFAVKKRFEHLPKCNIHILEKSAHVLPLDNDYQAIIECIKDNI